MHSRVPIHLNTLRSGGALKHVPDYVTALHLEMSETLNVPAKEKNLICVDKHTLNCSIPYIFECLFYKGFLVPEFKNCFRFFSKHFLRTKTVYPLQKQFLILVVQDDINLNRKH